METGSSSRATQPANYTPSENANLYRTEHKVATRAFIAEREIDWGEDQVNNPYIRILHQVIFGRNWLKVTRKYLGYYSDLVRDFNVNFELAGEDRVHVRGKDVEFSQIAIS